MNKSQDSQMRCAWCREYFTPTKKRKSYCSASCYAAQRDHWTENKSRQNQIPGEIAEFLQRKYDFTYTDDPDDYNKAKYVNGEHLCDDLLNVLFVDVVEEGISHNKQLITAVIVSLCVEEAFALHPRDKVFHEEAV